MKEIKDFLDPKSFSQLHNFICGHDFPWKLCISMTPQDKNPYFTHMFYDNFKSVTPTYEQYIIPMLYQLNCATILQARANLFVSDVFDYSGWHADITFVKGKTAILYLNDCDGGTQFKINDKLHFVKAEANKVVIFDNTIMHRAVNSKTVKTRFIINLNYVENLEPSVLSDLRIQEK
jgi:hypothetical protein